jgi:predicted short-subunit dehydrogenase-like oxidoreductase (DUF2520 family)
MDEIRSILIVGTGNAAWHLGINFLDAGLHITGIAARDTEKAVALSVRLGSVPVYGLSDQLPEADATLLLVRDDAVEEVAKLIAQPGRLVIHCSGSISAEAIKMAEHPFAVAWPLQTLQKEHPRALTNTVVAITASDAETEQKVAALFGKISNRVHIMSEHQRSVMHMCAVWINNYTNHMLHIGHTLLSEEGLEFSMFFPIIEEHLQLLHEQTPGNLQTGPAKRGDMGTLSRHMALLEDHPEWKDLYDRLSKSIINTYIKK